MKQFNPSKISGRLKLFAAYALDHEDFWDVCCDHGHAGMLVLLQKKAKTVHFVDPVPSIMEKLGKELLNFCDSEESYQLHQQKGENLNNIQGTLLIAGVGGKLMNDIVTSLLKRNELHAKRLLLSPHTDEKKFNLLINSEVFSTKYQIKETVPLENESFIKKLFIFDSVQRQEFS